MRHRFTVHVVPEEGSWCTRTSACFSIWIGGIARSGNRVGIHRFSYDSAAVARLSRAQVRAQEVDEERRETEYLTRMGAPAFLIARMFATASYNMYYLAPDEIALLRSMPGLGATATAQCARPPIQPAFMKPGAQPVDPASEPCYRDLLKRMMRDGVRAYLGVG